MRYLLYNSKTPDLFYLEFYALFATSPGVKNNLAFLRDRVCIYAYVRSSQITMMPQSTKKYLLGSCFKQLFLGLAFFCQLYLNQVAPHHIICCRIHASKMVLMSSTKGIKAQDMWLTSSFQDSISQSLKACTTFLNK